MENYSIQTTSLAIIERENEVAKILSREKVLERWRLINYTPPINSQLTLNLK